MAWIEAVRDRGIDSTIRVGTPGPAGIKRLLGFARRFGVGANAMIVKKYGFSLTNLMGTAGPDRFVTDLSALLAETAPTSRCRTAHDPAAGPVKLHFYTFGGLLRDVRVGARLRRRPVLRSRPMTLHTEALRDHACLIVHGPDRPGIVAAVTALITRNQGNIVSLDQYSDDPIGGAFFQRVVFHRADLTAAMPAIEADLDKTLGRARDWSGRSPTSPSRSGWRSSRRRPTTACSSCSGGTAAASCR